MKKYYSVLKVDSTVGTELSNSGSIRMFEKIEDVALKVSYNMGLNNAKLFEVEPLMDVEEDKEYPEIIGGTIYKSDKIRILREITQDEICDYLRTNQDTVINNPNRDMKLELARLGIALDILYKDPDPIIRMTVAEHCYELDTLVKDPAWIVRYQIARKGKRLHALRKDTHMAVRMEVAIHRSSGEYDFEELLKLNKERREALNKSIHYDKY